MALDSDLGTIHARALEQSARVIAAIRPVQMTAATPCARWNVQQLVNHMVTVNHAFSAAARGERLEGARRTDAPDVLGDDPAAAHAASLEAVRQAFATPDAIERTWSLPIGDVPGAVARNIHLTDTVAHSWDLATATGQLASLDPEIAEVTLGSVRGLLPDDLRNAEGDPFAPAVDVADSAPSYDRLAGFLGRRPS